MASGPVLRTGPLGPPPWETRDPFLFCVHHVDHYPAGNDAQGPAASLAGRALGQDFAGSDGWRMYHGRTVPGFPQHPHRGFETVTVVQRGFVDHSDSLGATARYGAGDVQWLTAGGGIQHAEMFPLVERARDNPLELFQIWLNLPAADKMAAPHFAMFWDPDVPRVAPAAGVNVTLVAGALDGRAPPAPPPASWASRADADVAIWTAHLAPGARWALPPARRGSHRRLYLHRGAALAIAGADVPGNCWVDLDAEASPVLEARGGEAGFLLLQGRPIGEPVAQYGPFVMSTRAEVAQAFADYQRTQFGGWPWATPDPVHPRDAGRFARHVDGRVERPAQSS
jgi:hypothetical protein